MQVQIKVLYIIVLVLYLHQIYWNIDYDEIVQYRLYAYDRVDIGQHNMNIIDIDCLIAFRFIIEHDMMEQ